MKGCRLHSVIAILLTSCCAAPAFAETAPPSPGGPLQAALNTLPDYGVFDYLTANDLGAGKVRLSGQVTEANLKAAAEKAVRGLPGVTGVENAIEILPASADDEALRKSVYHAVYEPSAPSPYAGLKSIHIIVKKKWITLEGTVNSEIDRTMIVSAATGTGKSYGLTDHLVALAPDSPGAQWRLNLDAVIGPSVRR